jgi:hypothetical protein
VASPARLIVTICIAEALHMAAFSAFATLLPVLAPEFGLNNSQAGLIDGIVLGGFLSCVMGFLAAHRGRRCSHSLPCTCVFRDGGRGRHTGGAVPAAEPVHRGATISLYSLI